VIKAILCLKIAADSIALGGGGQNISRGHVPSCPPSILPAPMVLTIRNETWHLRK